MTAWSNHLYAKQTGYFVSLLIFHLIKIFYNSHSLLFRFLTSTKFSSVFSEFKIDESIVWSQFFVLKIANAKTFGKNNDVLNLKI